LAKANAGILKQEGVFLKHELFVEKKIWFILLSENERI
jgi:hypothetical protein